MPPPDPSAVLVGGTQGYAAEAEAILQRYEAIDFRGLHQWAWHLIPAPPARVLDIGSDTGRDAAGFAAMGYAVTAAEPTAALRTGAIALHKSPRIEWLDDSLPDLHLVARRGETFDAVLMTAVWMHLDASARTRCRSSRGWSARAAQCSCRSATARSPSAAGCSM